MSDLRKRLLNSGATMSPGAISSGPTLRAATGPPTSPWKRSSAGSLANPFATIFAEIRKANEAGLAHAALALTLTIPDICCALISPKGKGGGPAYAAWFDEHLPFYRDKLPGKDLHQLRCGLLHEARSDRRHMVHDRVVFETTGRTHRASVKGGTINGVLQPSVYVINVGLFSYEMISAAEKWFEAHAGNANVIANAPKVVRYRANVIPFVWGIGGIC